MSDPLKTTRTVFELPRKGTWFYDLAVRHNGDILATRLDDQEEQAAVWTINPTTGEGKPFVSFPPDGRVRSVSGIAELKPDVFVVAVGHYLPVGGPDPHPPFPGVAVPGSWSLAVIDATDPNGIVSIAQSAAIPEAGFLSRLVRLDDHTVLAADSYGGLVYSVDITTELYDAAAQDPTMAAGKERTMGIGGMRLDADGLYYTNSATQTMYRFVLDHSDKRPGPSYPVETVAAGPHMDGLVNDMRDRKDTWYVCGNQDNVVYTMPHEGGETPVVLAGKAKSLDLAGATACAFGRRLEDQRVLYVVTNGGLPAPLFPGGPDIGVRPAKVVAIELDS